MLLSEGGIISDEVEFNGAVVFSDLTITNGLINAVNISELVEDIVYADTDQLISGKKNAILNKTVLEPLISPFWRF